MKPPSLRVKRRISYVLSLSFLCLLCPISQSPAQELTTPYNLTLVVHVAKNRLLTDVFRRRIVRDLHDGFQVGLGDMGSVSMREEHDRLDDVLSRGLLRSLDDWKERSDTKTHFVLIDYIDGQYEIQTRQYDGTIGQPSPVVRRDRTRDRDFVAKAAALLIKQDFGILGTVKTEPDGTKDSVKIELRGGALGDMSRWVKKDDIFALAPPGGGNSAALRFALLQVEQAPTEEARDGACTCRYFHRYDVKNIAGYRCIKLGTVQAPLRIRWAQRMPNGRFKPPDQPIKVEIRRFGFDGEKASVLEKDSNLNGVLETVHDENGVFRNVAFVQVIYGLGDTHPQVPIALVDDQPVIVEVIAPRDTSTLFSASKSEWQSRVADSVHFQDNLFRELGRMASNPANRSKIIDIAKSGLNRTKRDREELLRQRADLAKSAKKSGKALATPTEDQRLVKLEESERELVKFIEAQTKIEETENDPKRKKWRSEVERGKLLEKDLEIGKAIEIFENILKEGFDDKEVAEHLAKLRQDWELRGKDKKAHGEARGFIYRVWPTVDIPNLEKKIPEAREAFKTCQDANDLISIHKLLRGTLVHVDALVKKLGELQPELRIDDEKEQQKYKKVSEQIVKLGEDIQEYLQKHADDK